ncbi:MAG: hypothetical protein DRR08_23710 [Candidatus Parabeggiatoa sp. nov. 2]|nr:MAG: hypothetical protein B6247_12030 [Beggiatoa sp. 4572_84]RKZ55665.1 MAG: hypothetical protein DRR08_23710 [Gammaproteobacteria bacterium]
MREKAIFMMVLSIKYLINHAQVYFAQIALLSFRQIRNLVFMAPLFYKYPCKSLKGLWFLLGLFFENTCTGT